MAQLDRFLDVLIQRDARELRLASGEPAALVFADGLKPISTIRPTAEQVLGLLGELLEPDVFADLQVRGRLDTELLRPCGALVLRVVADGDTVSAVFAPWSYAVMPPAETDIEHLLDPERLPVSGPVPVTPPASLGAPGPAPAAEPVPARPSAPVVAPVRAPASGRACDGLDDLLRLMVAKGASDLHLCSGQPPVLRLDGDLHAIEDWEPLGPEQVDELIRPLMSARHAGEFDGSHDTDLAHEIAGLARFRVNVFLDRKGPGAVFRQIPAKILTAEQLGIPPQVLELCKLTKGLVLVTGPTGSGKSTTLTALIDHINDIRQDHVITIEDPIEFVHESRSCVINQREVGTHTESFKRALRAALREDPDILLVGEMRDLETIAIALETAETGHLVFGTLHTSTAVSTVDRIIDQFPTGQQAQVRTMLSESLKGVIAQILCRKVGGGRVAAMEILIGTPSVANLVREGKTFQIPSVMQTGKKYGMVTLNDALVELVHRGLIDADEAYLRAVDKIGIASLLKAVPA